MFFAGVIQIDVPKVYDNAILKKYAEQNNPYETKLLEKHDKNIHIWYSYNKCISKEEILFLSSGDIKIIVLGNLKPSRISKEKLFHIYKKRSFGQIYKDFKGEYLIIFFDNHTQRFDIIKSPIARFNVYYKYSDGTMVISSNLDCFLKNGQQKTVLDDMNHIKAYLASYLFLSDRLSNSTPYENVFRVMNGTRVRIKGMVKKVFYLWKPKIPIKSKQTLEGVAEEVRRILNKSLNDFFKTIKDGSEICIFLSGGYDSSTVAYLVEEIIKKFGYNLNVKYIHYLYQGNGNEMKYVEKIACDTKRSLYPIKPEKDNAFLSNFLPLRKFVEPNEQVLYGHSESAGEKMGDIFLNGCGGDHLLLAAPESVIGFLSKPCKEWLTMIKNLSEKNHLASANIILKYAVKKIKFRFRYRDTYLYDICTKDFCKQYLDKCAISKYPKCFFDELSQKNYERIYCGSLFPNTEGSGSINFSPFYNQEVIEFCLNIPAYYKYDGLENRIVHKKAMEDLLPSLILDRNSKSSNEESIENSVMNNYQELNEFFSNSFLEDMGIIKHGKIQDILKQLELGCCTDIPCAIKILTAEAWIRSWKE